MSRQVLILTPEAPYPLHSGGAYRTASLVHYFARLADVDLILLSESGQPALLPKGLVRSQHVIPLPRNSRTTLARYFRNARRAIRGVPPLIDRLSNLGEKISAAIGQHRYDLGLVEHFWCAPYVKEMKVGCGKVILNLHNVESALHARCAETGSGLQAAGHRRFAAASRTLEAKLLPRFDVVLATSESDRAMTRTIAPGARISVYPNALPTVIVPRVAEDSNLIVFPGNFEYHPNVDATQFLVSEIWPLVKQQSSAARVRLVGRGDSFVRHLIPTQSNIDMTGPVDDAFGEIARAAVVVAPLRAGSGTRIKILQAWAAARPVVATPLAAEGLDARDGENILLAETPDRFAQAIGSLLADTDSRNRIGAAGRQTFERHYTWSQAWKMLDQELQVLCPPEPGGYTE